MVWWDGQYGYYFCTYILYTTFYGLFSSKDCNWSYGLNIFEALLFMQAVKRLPKATQQAYEIFKERFNGLKAITF